jgi:hypothetical protein
VVTVRQRVRAEVAVKALATRRLTGMSDTADPGPSAAVLLEVVIAERGLRVDSLTAMDNRAGTLLGATGALIALAVLLPRWWLQLAIYLVAAETAYRCLRVLRVAYVPGVNAVTLRNDYLMSPATETRRVLLDLLVAKQDELKPILKEKADKATRALQSMGVLIAVTALAGLIGGLQ